MEVKKFYNGVKIISDYNIVNNFIILYMYKYNVE